jgi:glycosyltransferase involved in cell wall biosynthesis
MKVLSLSTCPLDPLLGSGKTRLRWSEGLRQLGHSVEMVEPKAYETWHGMRRALRFRQAWGACAFVKEKLRADNYDLIEFFGGEFGMVTWQLSKLANRPLLVAHTDGLELLASEREQTYNPPHSFRSHFRTWFSSQTHERLSRAAFVYADAFVTGNELDQKYVLNSNLYPPERTAVIPPGIDSEYLRKPFLPEKRQKVIYAGSWIQRKGVDNLTKVMTSILTQKPDLHFDIYGTGVSEDVVLAHFPGDLHNRITVRSRVSSTENASGLAEAKVFFFPTYYEGFGLTLAESMACSCAAVSTPTGFGAELRNGEDAMICDFNDIEAMERSILTLLENEDFRLRIARNGWQRVQTLSWDANIKKLESRYTRWLSEFKQGAWGASYQVSPVRSEGSS